MSAPDIYETNGALSAEKISALIEENAVCHRTINAMRGRAIELEARINRLTISFQTLQQIITRSMEYEKERC